jgi:hypothetical protein
MAPPPPASGRLREAFGSLWASDKVFVVTFALLALAAIVPIWRVRFLPLLDLPNHLAAVHIWHDYDAPWARAKEFYELNLKPAPYSAYHVLTHLLAHGVGLEDANRLVLCGHVLTPPSAALFWAHRTQRSPWLSVLAFPLAFSLSWACGFLPFLVGLSLLLAGLAAVDLQLERPSRKRAVAVALLSLACQLGHPLTIFGYYVCVAVLLVCHRLRWRERLATALLFAPALALFAWQLLRFRSPMVSVQQGPRFKGVWVSWQEMIRSLPAFTLDSVSGDLDTRVFWVLLATASALLVWSAAAARVERRAARAPRPLPERLRDRRCLLLAAAMLACYLLVPLHLERPFDWWFVSGRYAPLLCLFGFLVPRPPLRGARRLVMLPAVVAALLLPLHLSQKYVEFNQRLTPFVRMVERARPGTDVLFLNLPPRTDDAVIIEALNHFSSWVQILHGGFSPSGWYNIGFPFLLKRRLPAPPSNRDERFNPNVHAGAYEYVIVRNENEQRPLFTAAHPAWRRVERDGAFTMYERTRPR